MRRGALIAHYTTSLPGIGVDPRNGAALLRLDAIKARVGRDGYVVVTGSVELARGWFAASDEAESLIATPWPGPVTIVLPAGTAAAPAVVSAAGTIALRIDRHPAVIALTGALGRPMISTSLNLPGEPPARMIEGLDDGLTAALDGAFVLGPRGEGVASTLISLLDGELRVLRSGSVETSTLLGLLGQLGLFGGRQ